MICTMMYITRVKNSKTHAFSILNLFRKEEFAITDMELSAMAKAATIGFNSPNAAIGTAPVL